MSADCDGCPCLHMATCIGALPEREAAALQLVKLLLEAGADSIQRCVRCWWECQLCACVRVAEKERVGACTGTGAIELDQN